MKNTKKNRFISAFFGSFKDLNYKSALIVLIDIFTFLLAGFALNKGIRHIGNIISGIPDPDYLLSLSLEQIEAALTPNPQIMIIVSLILLVAAVFIIFAVSRAAVWLLLENKKIGHKIAAKKKIFIIAFSKFTLILLCWYVIVLVPIAGLFHVMKEGVNIIFFTVAFLLFLHYSCSLNMALAKSQRFREIITALKIGTKKIHLFLLSYILLILAYVILSQTWWLYKDLLDSYVVPRIITVAIAMCWARYFMRKVVK